jgi:hypothetical protein
VGDGEVEIAVGEGHEAEKVGRVGLARPDGENLPAGHLRFVRPPLPPCGAAAFDRLADVDRRMCVGRRDRHGLDSFAAIIVRRELRDQAFY